MVPHLLEAGVSKRVIDVYTDYKFHHYAEFSACPQDLIHDVKNCGYKIMILGKENIFYATDTGTLDGVEAQNYDLYLIEANHTRAEIEARISEKQARGEFAYETRAATNHLSQEQALDWLARNAGPNSRYVFLHQHKEARNGLETP